MDAVNRGQVSPDTAHGRLQRIADPAHPPEMCVVDNDDFFLKSVQRKTRVGVVHMPAWKEVLSPTAIWTIRSLPGAASPDTLQVSGR